MTDTDAIGTILSELASKRGAYNETDNQKLKSAAEELTDADTAEKLLAVQKALLAKGFELQVRNVVSRPNSPNHRPMQAKESSLVSRLKHMTA